MGDKASKWEIAVYYGEDLCWELDLKVKIYSQIRILSLILKIVNFNGNQVISLDMPSLFCLANQILILEGSSGFETRL